MNKIPVILIFDVGKTNKKVMLFDEQYKVVHEESKQLPEITDEEGFPCEDVNALSDWVSATFNLLTNDKRFYIKAVNFSAYGASFVYLDENKKNFLPLYNYLKPYPEDLQKRFYNTYGGESLITKQTASPALGNLNSGMQIYRLKYEKPEAYGRIKYALHLPQYLSYILCKETNTDITSIGCHTGLWDFEKNNYHKWVKQEGIDAKFLPIKNCTTIAGHTATGIPVGIGIHDSSAAMIPYQIFFIEPFILLSTGTWCISLNPFNPYALTDDELQQDCLCYLSYEGKPVKASRLFAGHLHEQQAMRLAEYFTKPADYFTTIKFEERLLKNQKTVNLNTGSILGEFNFANEELDKFSSYEEAYHQLMAEIIALQVKSTGLVLKGTAVNRIFVDGGFGKNSIYMNLLARAYRGIEVFAATMAQASALGAALVMHKQWNTKPLPTDIIKLKLYSVK